MRSPVKDGADLARRTLVALAVIVPTLAASIPAKSAPRGTAEWPPDLEKAVKDYDQATINNDTEALAGLVAEDYVLVNSDTTVQHKQSYLADFKVPGFRIDPYVMEQPLLKMWGNVALTGGLLRLGWTQDGRHQIRLLRIAHVWERQHAHWRIKYTQLTRVPE
jgi:ketosteroid isomerase-like protein